MKRLLWVALCLSLTLSGCGIGGYTMTGMVLDKDLKSIKSYGEYWVKDGVTVEQKRRDAWDCGAAPHNYGADHVSFTHEKIKAEMRPGEPDYMAARSRLTQAWVECMKFKGYEYRYTGPR